MNNCKLKNLLFLSYSLMFLSGAIVILPFILKDTVAYEFHSTITYTGYVCSFFMVGMLSAQISNGIIIKFISLKNEIFIVVFLYFISVLCLFHIQQLTMLTAVFFIHGFCFGILNTISYYIIVYSFENSSRSSLLNLLGFFFGVGSLSFPVIVAYMLARSIDWRIIYILILAILVLITLVLFTVTLPNISSTSHVGKNKQFSCWTVNTYIIGLVIFLTFLSYIGFTYWVDDYLIEYYQVKIQTAALVISFFWIFYSLGGLLASYAVRKIAIDKYIMLSVILSLISYFVFYFSSNIVLIYISVSALGLGCSAIYISSLSYGTLVSENPSPLLVSFFVFASGIGTLTAQFYSSYIQSILGLKALIILSMAIMFFVFVLVYFVSVNFAGKLKK